MVTNCLYINPAAPFAFSCRSNYVGLHRETNFLHGRYVLTGKSQSSARRSWRLCSPNSLVAAFSAVKIEEDESASDWHNKAAALIKDLRVCFNAGKTKSFDWRISQLKSIEKMVDEKEKDILAALHQDLAKPEQESFLYEILHVKNSCKLAVKELNNWMTPERVKTSFTTYPSSAEIVPEPLGVVLVISTWNYPFLLSLDPVIGAIAAGNAVVLKPSEIAPATSSLLANLLPEYVDSSAIRVIEGAVSETTALLEQNWDKIFYTGSARVGRIVMSAAAKHLTPVVLELGGKCPAVVDSDVDLQIAARRIVAGKWGCNSGQTCVSPDYVITTKAFALKLIDSLRSELINFFGDTPLESKDMSRIVNSYHFSRLAKLMDDDRASDKIVVGGQRNEHQLRIAPTILLNVPEDCPIMNEEIFGPLLPIQTVENVKDSFEYIKSRPKPLAAYLFTNNETLKKDFVDAVSAGGVAINDTVLQVTVESLPFGGVGESGMGSYNGKFSFDAFSHKKAVLYRSFGGESSTRYPPYTPAKFRLLKALINFDILGILFQSSV
ncbi:aldehyde dehydrogenase family 3 member H1-like isoform X2 [Impatiens glandulifera]|uniref:aldehyde dehydrogenase family 3 member H1-like isoform X2 n=1 Tax=Impatiens glandulifera TaxID=253017 RepID=UPI001FB0C82E|nr:aldehyde dehydrogenase family 3 member H1-like isoform X2 [Impatiens glandulifera]